MKKIFTAMAPLAILVIFVSSAQAINIVTAEVQGDLAVVHGNRSAKQATITWEGADVTQTNKGGTFSFSGSVPGDCVGTLSDGVDTIEVALANCQPVPEALAPLARTGQVTSYAPGDDGDLQMGVPSPTPRFTDNGDSAVTDRLTGLTWTKDASQYQPAWYDALNVCNSYSVGTFDDWRLPNIKELLSLLDFEQKYPMLPVGHPFKNVLSGYYWSSTTSSVYDNYGDVYAVNMDTGDIRIWNKRSGGNILCVRGGF
jgi:hypothetical protein